METGFHSIIQDQFVIHSHSVYALILCCSKQGQKILKEIFPQSIWINYCNPGLGLTYEISKKLAKEKSPIIFLQNHGLIITANQEPTTNFNAPTAITATLTVAKATPTVISNPTSTAIGYGQTLGSSTLSGGVASVSGTFAFSNTTSVPAAGTSGQNVIFTPSDTANYNTVETSVSVTVNKAIPTIMALPGFMSATGGTKSGSGDFIIHTFTNVGNSTFTPTGSDTVEILVVAGGGGAGFYNAYG
jgi:hypothetical protein